MIKRFTLTILLVLFCMPGWAATQTVTLSVPGMDCAACPITVKAALNKVEGVSSIEVDYPNRMIVVSFEDTLVSVDDLTKATTDAGYPSSQETSEAESE